MKLGRLKLWVLCCGIACKPTQEIDASIPAEVRYALLAKVDGAGEVISASALVPWGEGQPLPLIGRFSDPGQRFVVLGFSEAQIAPYLPLEEETPFRQAQGCEQRLPAPMWQADWTGDALLEPTPEALSTPLLLTAPWLSSRCPDMSGHRFSINTSCRSDRCEPQVGVVGCVAELDLSECQLPNLQVRIGAAGELCAESSTADVCETLTSEDPHADSLLQCTLENTCSIEVYATDDPPAFTIDRASFIDPPAQPYIPGSTAASGVLRPRRLIEGNAFDLAIVNDRILVLQVIGDPGLNCPSFNRPMELLNFDPETLEMTRSALPRCTERLHPDPSGMGAFVATFVEGNEIFVGRFAMDGTVLERAVLDPGGRITANSHFIVDIIPMSSPGQLLLHFVSRDGTPENPVPEDTGFVVIETATLQTLRSHHIDGWRRAWTADLMGDRLYLVEYLERASRWINVNNWDVVERLDLVEELTTRISLLDVFFEPSTQKMLVAAQGPAGMYIVERGRVVFGREVIYRAKASVTALSPWSGGLVLSTGVQIESAGREAVAFFFDPAVERFLPQRYELGYGVVSRAKVDAKGRTWLLLPWAGEVVRLTPTGP